MRGPAVRGIDISSHQGMIDFDKVKQAGYSFVIVKAGEGTEPRETFRKRYLPAIQKAGLDWGAYWWTNAVTVEEARAEARAFLKEMEGLKPTFPLWVDQEYESPCSSCTKQRRTDIVKAFLDVLQEAGYYAGLYCSYDWITNWLDASQLTAYDKWIAQYSSHCSYTGAYGIWQNGVIGTKGEKGVHYTILGKVPGVEENCDVDYCYKDYPKIIKAAGLNGWGDKPPEQDFKVLYLEAKAKLDKIAEIIKE